MRGGHRANPGPPRLERPTGEYRGSWLTRAETPGQKPPQEAGPGRKPGP